MPKYVFQIGVNDDDGLGHCTYIKKVTSGEIDWPNQIREGEALLLEKEGLDVKVERIEHVLPRGHSRVIATRSYYGGCEKEELDRRVREYKTIFSRLAKK